MTPSSALRTTLCVLATLLAGLSASAQTVRITEKPTGLSTGMMYVPVVATAPVERLEILINGVKWAEGQGQVLTAQVNLGLYVRRLRVRAVGYDAAGSVVGEDDMVINDPRPPFRVRLSAPPSVSAERFELAASVTYPREVSVRTVEFYVGETMIGADAIPPYTAVVEGAAHEGAAYARVVARAADGSEANDVAFFGDRVSDEIDVAMQQIPVSIAKGPAALRLQDLTLFDSGMPRKIEALVPASSQPLNVILLIDYSESMLEELPVVKEAAKQFAKSILRRQDRIAVVGFHQRTFWLTGYTNDWNSVAQAVDRVQPIGETHLFDSVVEMLFELQKMPGRHALIVLTDGVDQGSRFKLEHLVHYARYAGVPVYPIVKNTSLARLMRLGVGRLQARRLGRIAEETGATYFIINKERELPGVYARIANELARQYQLVFHSDAGVPDQWRPLRVESKAGHQLRIPKGYFP
ncbi:MAG: VWA domain-containing protein [Thermoanaerobaculia bacterium]